MKTFGKLKVGDKIYMLNIFGLHVHNFREREVLSIVVDNWTNFEYYESSEDSAYLFLDEDELKESVVEQDGTCYYSDIKHVRRSVLELKKMFAEYTKKTMSLYSDIEREISEK